jgi:hypothetical protein
MPSYILNLVVTKGKGSPSAALSLRNQSTNWKLTVKWNALYRTKNSKTSHMRVLATHVVCYHDNLQDVCIYWLAVTRNNVSFEQIPNGKEDIWNLQAVFFLPNQLRRHIKSNPSVWLFQCSNSDVLKITRTSACSDGKGRRSVGIVQGKAEAYRDFLTSECHLCWQYQILRMQPYLYSHFPRKFNRDEMGLGAIRTW